MATIEPIVIPDATSQPGEYVAALLRTLGGRDPLAVLERTPAEARRCCQELDGRAWTAPMAPGEWSALQVVGHLLDVDVVYGFRWRLALTEEEPTYPGYDEKAWSRRWRRAASRPGGGVIEAPNRCPCLPLNLGKPILRPLRRPYLESAQFLSARASASRPELYASLEFSGRCGSPNRSF